VHEAIADSEPAEDHDGDPARPEYARDLERRFRKLTPKHQSILRRRVCDRATLDEVGAGTGLTPQQVRQVEAQALDKLAGKPPNNIDNSGVLGGLLEFIDAIDGLHAERVREAVAELGQLELPVTESRLVEAGFEQLDCPTTQLLLAVAKRMDAFGGKKARVLHHGGRQWLVVGDRTPERLVRELTEGARDTGVLSDLVEFWTGIEDKLRAHAGSDTEAAILAADAVEGLGLTEIGGQYAVLGGVGVTEGLVRILRANEAPMKRDVLVGCFPDRKERTVSNALFDNPFVRVGRDEFALQEWGVKPRPMLRDLVYSEIDRYDQVAVSYLQDLAAKYGYSRNSIGFYSALPDIVEDAGVLRRRRADDRPPVPDPSLNRACFRIVAGPHRGCWSCKVVVSHERLYHGSQVIPTPLAELLEIEPGSRQVEVSVNGTAINASWAQQNPYLFARELRRLLDRLGFADGDPVRFVVVGSGKLQVLAMPANSSPESPYRTLVTGAGLYDDAGEPVSDAELAAALAFAVGLPADTPLHAVERRLRNRRNPELRDALVQIYREVFDQ
jgi:Sigma-70, region 4